MTIKIDLVQGSQEWLRYRNTRIGASDAPAIMGIGFLTPFQLWEIKSGLKQQQENDAMRYGKQMEEEARKSYIELTGNFVLPETYCHDNNWMMASLDGWNQENRIAVEIKCPKSIDHTIACEGEIPEKYFPQLQHQMAVMDIEEMHYFSWSPFSQHLVIVKRDQPYIDNMMEKEYAFLKCILEMEPPERTDRDYVQRNDAIWKDAALDYLRLSSQSQAIEIQKEAARKRLITLSGESNSMGCGIKMTRYIQKGRIDYESIPELKDVDIELYRKKPTSTIRISNI